MSYNSEQINHAHHEGTGHARKAVGAYKRAGKLLTKAHDKMPRGCWLKWVGRELVFSDRTAYKYITLAKTKLKRGENMTNALARVIDHKPAVETLTSLPDEPEPADLAEPVPHVAHATGDYEWFTPAPYIASAKQVMGGIDLDPASCDLAQATVQADAYYTKETDGLAHDWKGKIYLNPPYNNGLVSKFVDKTVTHFLAGDISEAIVLTNNATETAWFNQLTGCASALCFPAGRIKFDTAAGIVGAPLQGQCFFYLGDHVDTFDDVFHEQGIILFPKV